MQEKLLKSISGIRGIVGRTFTAAEVLKFSSAFGNYCKGGKVVLGRDTRKSGEVFRGTVLSGLLCTGCEVIDLGICPTPTVGIAVKGSKAKGGIMITASHNPAEWNGLKFFNSDGIFLDEREGKKLFSLAEKEISYSDWDSFGKVRLDQSWIEKHIQRILNLSFINKNEIKKKKFKVVLDCNNGAGSRIAPSLLRELGCKVIELNCGLSGDFSHQPEPVPENLDLLCRKIKQAKADLGFACDPDADRLAVVSDKGIPLGEEYTLALCVDFVLSKRLSDVGINVSTSKVIEDVARKYGVKVFRSKVGEVYVVSLLKKIKGIIGGEGNGGVILPENHYGRDAQSGMALILQYLAESDKKISQLKESLPQYYIQKDKMKLSGDSDAKMRKYLRKFRQAKINNLDGVKVEFENSWINIRKSNTEPIIRVMAEAKSQKEAEKLVLEAKRELN
ncbi:MAG: phosphoglucosamine mutase [candidate division Zixibacteria bacterium]|nr:phosphoglucosamine mutase [candidate division Zixibacteria bacterium]